MKKYGHEDIDFLQCIYKNAEMGIIGIDNVINKVKDDKLKEFLKKERNEYDRICEEARLMLKKAEKPLETIGLMSKMSTKMMTDMILFREDRGEIVVKMMLEGTNKGIIEIVEKINAYNNSDSKIMNLAKKLKKILENNIEELKKFL